MRQYELTYIISPDADDDSAVMNQVEEWIQAASGAIQKVSDWGRRRLAYAIKDQNEGHYIHLEVDLAPSEIGELERNLKLNEDILRHLLVRAEEE